MKKIMKSPFKFLDSYTIEDRAIFFGREQEISELHRKVFESKILLVYGISGTGKSSLINCGLASEFDESDWLPVNVRRGGNIITSLNDTLSRHAITRLKPTQSVTEKVQSLYLDYFKPVFLIFDQFEELFIFGKKEERKTFISVIKSLTESELLCRIIFVIREEYMAGLTEFEKVVPLIFHNRMRIEKISHRNAIEAIQGPCLISNITLEEGFVEALLEKLSPGSEDVELTYLQVFLDKIFRLAGGNSPFEEPVPPNLEDQGDVIFTHSLLEKTGNVSDLLGDFLDEQISLLDDPETGLSLLKSFVSVKGTKQPMTTEEAREYALTLGKDIKEPVIKEMIQTFVNLRILCDKDLNGRHELRHDSLAAKVFEKFTLAEKELLEVRKYVENAFFVFEKRGVLLNKQDLDYLSGYETVLILPQNLNNFIKLCKNKLLTQKRYLTRITRISALVFILIIAAVLRIYYNNQKSLNATNLIGTALLQSQRNPLKGLLTATNLWERSSTSSVLEYIVLNELKNFSSITVDTSNPGYWLKKNLEPFLLESSVVKAKISKSGKYIYGWMQNKHIFIWNTINRNDIGFEANGNLAEMEFSERDSLVALIYDNNKVDICDFMGKTRFTFETNLNKLMNERLLRFFPEGEYLLAVVKNNSILVFNKNGDIVSELNAHSANVNSVDISEDGQFLATASSDKEVNIWKYNNSLKKINLINTLTGHNDTVWSCEFNRTGKYIITASADSTVRIWNLYGKQINPEFQFLVNRVRFNNREPDKDALDPFYSVYYSKNCDASFSVSEKEIIVTGYSYIIDSFNHSKTEYKKVLFYDKGSTVKRKNIDSFIDFVNEDYIPVYHRGFENLIVAPSGDLIAGIPETTSKIFIYLGVRLCLLTLDGNFPMYSADGGSIYWINNNEINCLPLKLNTVKKIIDKSNISESLSSTEETYTRF